MRSILQVGELHRTVRLIDLGENQNYIYLSGWKFILFQMCPKKKEIAVRKYNMK